ncbi:MAG TPA: hypothetical protein VMM27_14370 [Casimicrobiaceae bacterium]|nr:hypothetical protein [Casimicrobiaceae bacterium]
MSNGCFALRLDGDTTLLSGAAGGEIFAQVVEDAGAVPYIKKHPGPVQYEDITVDVGFAMSDMLFDWIAAAWAGKDQPKDGALLAAGYDLTIKAERQFKSAHIAATVVPALDATSKATSPLSVRLAPASIALASGAGKLQLKALKQPIWRASNFKLEIDGLDCSKVMRIDSFTVPGVAGGKVAFPTLAVTLAATSAPTWNSWLQDFLIAGNSGDAAEKSGKISFLLPDLKTSLARIELRGLGIVGLETAPGGPSQVAKLTASLYCEQMSLHRDKP